MNELERALLDIAEVRDRIALSQRFRGYSGVAAIASGVFALVAGAVQAFTVPYPSGEQAGRVYFAIWFACCAAAAIVNYGAIAHWFVNVATPAERAQTKTVGLSILPALTLGAALSFALFYGSHVVYLPGVWYGCYGVGLFASRTMIPRAALAIAAIFLLAAVGLLFAPPSVALAWYVIPLGFGLGQIAIGACILRERSVR